MTPQAADHPPTTPPDQRMGALEKHADFENLVDTALVHVCSKLDFLAARVKHING